MMKLKIAFIGLGSIAKRHISNLSRCLDERDIDRTIDVVRHGERAVTDPAVSDKISNVYTYEDGIPDDYDIIFVTNPTEMHYGTVRRYTGNTKHMFIEKPVFTYRDLDKEKIVPPEGSVYYVACPLRYTGVIQYLRSVLPEYKVNSVRAVSSSYLPEWRPGTDYRKTYSANKSLGGGVSTDLIHEWDYLVYLFGFPKKVFNINGHFSDLEIDTDDVSVYIGASDSMTYELHLDYCGRSTVRRVEIFAERDTIAGDLAGNKVSFLKSGKTVSFDEDRNVFQKREIDAFLDMILSRKENTNTIDTAAAVLGLTRGEIE